MSKETDVGYLETACEECGHRVVRYGVISQNELTHLREQNRVLRLEFQSLLNVIDDSYDEDLPVEIVEARNKAQAALTATSQEGQG